MPRPFLLGRDRAAIVLAAFLVAMATLASAPARAQTAGPAVVHIGYVADPGRRMAAEPYFDPPPADEGLAGARLAIADDNTTGRFTGQQFILDEAALPPDGDPAATLAKLAESGARFIVANLPAVRLLALAALPAAQDLIIFNTAAPEDELRADKCRANLLHTIPSRAMLADALVQYLIVKQWPRIFLVTGPTEGDRAYAAAIKHAVDKFHAKLAAEKAWTYKPGARRSDTGHYAMTAQIASFTQGVRYDVLVVADEDDEFGDYLSYATYDPRPVAGTHGLVPSAWARPHQEWGATQLQDRFRRLDKRWMTDRDYAAWLAVRAVGEAATRAQSTEPAKIAAYMRGDKFQLAGYKGLALSFRPWDGQMRQAILLADATALVSVSPQPGFLHQFSELDTLGIDRPESKCHLP
jgi:ABC transporter substrate binding protein (PQQ-dependent alcohol dehydrogenase system)